MQWSDLCKNCIYYNNCKRTPGDCRLNIFEEN